MRAVDRIAAPNSPLTCIPLAVWLHSQVTPGHPCGLDFGRSRVTCLSQCDMEGSDGEAILSWGFNRHCVCHSKCHLQTLCPPSEAGHAPGCLVLGWGACGADLIPALLSSHWPTDPWAHIKHVLLSVGHCDLGLLCIFMAIRTRLTQHIFMDAEHLRISNLEEAIFVLFVNNNGHHLSKAY